MNKLTGIISTSLFGETNASTLRQVWRDTKETQSLTDASLRSMLFNGDAIPHIPYGKLFRIDLGRRSTVLAISTRFGPIVLKPISKHHIEILMNRTLEPVSVKKRKDLDNDPPPRINPLLRYLGCVDRDQQFFNIGEMVERELQDK